MKAASAALDVGAEASGVVASPERVDAWMEVAQPGDRFVYAVRSGLPSGSPGARRLRILSQQRLVELKQARSDSDPSVFRYMAERTGKPSAMTRPSRPVLSIASAPVIDDEAVIVDALLPILTRFAAHGRPCPTDRQLGERAGLSEEAVKAGLAAMVAAHLIHVDGCSAPTYRRVRILATGHMTGLAA